MAIKYIKRSNLPPSAPISTAIVWWLFLEYLKAPGWVYGVLGTVYVTAAAIEIWRGWSGKAVDLMAGDKP